MHLRQTDEELDQHQNPRLLVGGWLGADDEHNYGWVGRLKRYRVPPSYRNVARGARVEGSKSSRLLAWDSNPSLMSLPTGGIPATVTSMREERMVGI